MTMSPLRRFVASGLAVATVAATLVAGATAAGASGSAAVTVTATPSTVLPGNTLDLVAAMPVAGTGTVAQEIVMQIDPTKVKLTSVTDIKAPAGWTVTYCSTTCDETTNFSATVPANAAAWAAVKAVRAVGSVDSQGEYQGKQLASRTSSVPIPATGPFASSGSGDGWSVFFDDRGYVFNIFHHNGFNRANVGCRDRNGVSCGSNWPALMSNSPFRHAITDFGSGPVAPSIQAGADTVDSICVSPLIALSVFPTTVIVTSASFGLVPPSSSFRE